MISFSKPEFIRGKPFYLLTLHYVYENVTVKAYEKEGMDFLERLYKLFLKFKNNTLDFSKALEYKECGILTDYEYALIDSILSNTDSSLVYLIPENTYDLKDLDVFYIDSEGKRYPCTIC